MQTGTEGPGCRGARSGREPEGRGVVQAGPFSPARLPVSDSDDGAPRRSLATHLRHAFYGGLVTALVMAGIVVFVGAAGGAQARHLLEATLPTTRFLCSSVMTAAATTLALMLTMLSVSASVDARLKEEHYRRIRQIALVDVVAFVGATVLLVTLVIPFGEDIEVPSAWYTGIYYVVTLLSALLGGVLVAVMIMLYTAVRDLIGVIQPGEEGNGMLADDGDAEQG